MTFQELLLQEFAPYGELTPLQLRQAEDHYKLLLHWNARMNLTRIEGLVEAVQMHYCESFFLAKWLPAGVYSVVDVGSGGGFPGIPVAILRPELQVTLVESHKRKSVFLREAVRELKNVRVLDSRAQDVAQRFDWLVSRAVAVPEVLGLDLAPRKAVLTSLVDSPEESEIIRLPWGTNRVITVPRETTPS